MTELRMDVTDMDETVSANFKFVNPPKLSVYDSNGNLITSGPDSNLVRYLFNCNNVCFIVFLHINRRLQL